MNWQSIPGWSCPVLLALYDELASALMPGQVFVEVGVAYGRSLAYMASKARPGVQILGVDSWLVKMGRNTPEVWNKVRHYTCAFDAACDFLHMSEALRRVELCRGNSHDVAHALDFEVDAVFLDGSHEYAAVTRDIMAWMPRVKKGGILAGHDINSNYPGVGQAVRELCPGAEVRPPAPGENGWGGVWRWRKP